MICSSSSSCSAAARHVFSVQKNPGFLKKAQPFGFYLVLSFIGFSDFLFERPAGKLVG